MCISLLLLSFVSITIKQELVSSLVIKLAGDDYNVKINLGYLPSRLYDSIPLVVCV